MRRIPHGQMLKLKSIILGPFMFLIYVNNYQIIYQQLQNYLANSSEYGYFFLRLELRMLLDSKLDFQVHANLY